MVGSNISGGFLFSKGRIESLLSTEHLKQHSWDGKKVKEIPRGANWEMKSALNPWGLELEHS